MASDAEMFPFDDVIMHEEKRIFDTHISCYTTPSRIYLLYHTLVRLKISQYIIERKHVKRLIVYLAQPKSIPGAPFTDMC